MMRKFLMSAAAIALAAGGAYADPGNGKGKGADKAGGHAAMEAHGAGHGDGGKLDRGASMKAAAHSDHGPRANDARGPREKPDRPDRGPPEKAAKSDRASQANQARKVERSVERRPDRDYRRGDDRDYRREGYREVRTVSFGDRDRYGYIEGCPPGLAKKNHGCMPPGLAKKRAGWEDRYFRPSYFGYRSLGDGRYYYDDGYLYRTGANGSILGYIPLLGGALSIGNPWPSYYQPVSVPDYYVDYYNLGPANSYRYADNVLYRVDPETAAITSIAALLTGDQFAVGQPMPSGYDVYNVPYAYRDRYYDTPDRYYRYSDGYVYQVDPTTQLIQAAIQLLT
ncbi:hypothetical protein N0B51_14195 [Tsuneonella sp. YG55]|uniref:RcnB family protein n=1 Tax=Tsuneonella litorea TaxID=2976475 RepID=A0A9X3AAQ5_9SPHN|nr:hypothetical protein [Tsuneonella litorea]MCT2560130.1 hypothetical protein [Tsuneonella litorea]